MKKLIPVFFILIIIGFTSCNSTSPKDALKYNESIIEPTEDVDDLYNNLDENWDKYDVNTYDPSTLKLMNEQLVLIKTQLKTSSEEVKNLADFDNSSDYKNIAIDYYKTVELLCDTKWVNIISILEKGEKMTQEDLDECNKLYDEILTEKNAADSKFIDFQNSFAKKYGFEIENNENRNKIYDDLGIKH